MLFDNICHGTFILNIAFFAVYCFFLSVFWSWGCRIPTLEKRNMLAGLGEGWNGACGLLWLWKCLHVPLYPSACCHTVGFIREYGCFVDGSCVDRLFHFFQGRWVI